MGSSMKSQPSAFTKSDFSTWSFPGTFDALSCLMIVLALLEKLAELFNATCLDLGKDSLEMVAAIVFVDFGVSEDRHS